MSLLQKAIARQNGEAGREPNPFYSTKDHVSALSVESSGGEIWLLPWNHFVFGRHQEAGEREQLLLTFVAHEVAISGQNFGTLIKETVNQRLAKLRTAPGKYLQSSEDEPFIEQILVRALTE